jgi:hypothetical protein
VNNISESHKQTFQSCTYTSQEEAVMKRGEISLSVRERVKEEEEEARERERVYVCSIYIHKDRGHELSTLDMDPSGV